MSFLLEVSRENWIAINRHWSVKKKEVASLLPIRKRTGILLLRCFLGDDDFSGLRVTLKLRWCRVETKSDAARRDAIWHHPLRRYLSTFGLLPSFWVGIPTPPLVTRLWHRGPIYRTRYDPKLNYDSRLDRSAGKLSWHCRRIVSYIIFYNRH